MDKFRLYNLKDLTLQGKKKRKKMPDISRKISSYAIPFAVKTEAQIGATATPTDGFIWLIFNLESTFYSCVDLRNVLGLYPGSSASAETTAVTAIKINNTSELCRMGALGQLKVVIKAEDPSRTYGNLGQIHRTSFLYDLNKSIRDVARGLRDVKIKVGGSDIIYTIVPGSISEKKSKKTTPHF